MITPPPFLSGTRATARRVRRAVLRRRRPLAALCAAIAVAAGLQAAANPPPDTEPVVVAGRDLPAGTVIADTDLVRVDYAAGTAPRDLAVDPDGRVLAGAVRRGEPLTDVRLVGPDLVEGRSDLVALPLRFPDSGMATLLEVGDVIDLVAADPQQGGAQVTARDVEVLALPAADDAEYSGGTSGLSGRLVVLGVDPTDVPVVTGSAVQSYVTFTWGSR